MATEFGPASGIAVWSMRSRMLRSATAFLLAAVAAAATTAHASTPLYTHPSGSVRTDANGYPIDLGFSVGATPIDVTALGVWDQNGELTDKKSLFGWRGHTPVEIGLNERFHGKNGAIGG